MSFSLCSHVVLLLTQPLDVLIDRVRLPRPRLAGEKYIYAEFENGECFRLRHLAIVAFEEILIYKSDRSSTVHANRRPQNDQAADFYGARIVRPVWKTSYKARPRNPQSFITLHSTWRLSSSKHSRSRDIEANLRAVRKHRASKLYRPFTIERVALLAHTTCRIGPLPESGPILYFLRRWDTEEPEPVFECEARDIGERDFVRSSIGAIEDLFLRVPTVESRSD